MKTSTMAGRVAVFVPNHPKANNRGYVLRARYVMERKLGRLLREDEEVHHKNEDVTDDREENLEVKLTDEHARHHHPDGVMGRKYDHDAIVALKQKGLGYRRIAKQLKVPLSAVKYVFQHKLKVRA